MSMKKLTVLMSTLALGGVALAQTAAPAPAKAPEPDYTLAFNVGVVTDYRYRGISQSRFKPALQAGADFSHKSGIYLGTWMSTIKWLKDIPGGQGALEWDFYGGYKGAINDSLSYDVGILRYQYPRENFAVDPHTTEIYGALSFGPATLKYSHAISNLFGFDKSKNSGYLDLSATFDLGGGFTLVPHIGHQKVRGSVAGVSNNNFSYTDASIAANYDFGNGAVVSLTAVTTNVKKIGGVPAYVSPQGKDLGRSGLVAGIKYNF